MKFLKYGPNLKVVNSVPHIANPTVYYGSYIPSDLETLFICDSMGKFQKSADFSDYYCDHLGDLIRIDVHSSKDESSNDPTSKHYHRPGDKNRRCFHFIFNENGTEISKHVCASDMKAENFIR